MKYKIGDIVRLTYEEPNSLVYLKITKVKPNPNFANKYCNNKYSSNKLAFEGLVLYDTQTHFSSMIGKVYPNFSAYKKCELVTLDDVLVESL